MTTAAKDTHPDPVRILAVAPYEGLRTAILRAAEGFDGIRLSAFTGDMEEGCAVLRREGAENFDVIVSRGGTAELLHRETGIPVVDTGITVYDILRSIRLAETYSQSFSIVAFPRITQTAHTLCDLMRYHVDIITVTSAREAEVSLNRLREKGVGAVVCDMVTHTSAIRMGFNAFLITSGEESLHDAIARAREQGKAYRSMKRETGFLKSLLLRENVRAAILDREGNVVYSLPEVLPETLLSHFRKHLPQAFRTGGSEVRFYEQNVLHQIRFSPIGPAGLYTAFTDTAAPVPLKSVRSGMHSESRTECEYLLSGTIFFLNSTLGDIKNRIRLAADTTQPVMVTGEPGTGTEFAARDLYLQSQMTHRPLITLDCAVIDEKGWDFLLESHASPLVDGSGVLYFQHLDSIPPEKEKELLSGILSTSMNRRRRLIFSATYRENLQMPDAAAELCRRMGCVHIHIPTLRSRAEEIPALSGLYIMNQNVIRGRRVTGFDPDALRMLSDYEWPHNYVQLQNALDEMSVLTAGDYISARTCAEVLGKERQLYRTSSMYTKGTWPEEKTTMDSIITEAVLRTLEKNGGNQAAAARQLGISRTTLWRILKKGLPSARQEKPE